MRTKKHDGYLSVSEAARRLTISRGAVERRVAKGEMAGALVAGRLVISRESVEAAEREQQDSPDISAA